MMITKKLQRLLIIFSLLAVAFILFKRLSTHNLTMSGGGNGTITRVTGITFSGTGLRIVPKLTLNNNTEVVLKGQSSLITSREPIQGPFLTSPEAVKRGTGRTLPLLNYPNLESSVHGSNIPPPPEQLNASGRPDYSQEILINGEIYEIWTDLDGNSILVKPYDRVFRSHNPSGIKMTVLANELMFVADTSGTGEFIEIKSDGALTTRATPKKPLTTNSILPHPSTTTLPNAPTTVTPTASSATSEALQKPTNTVSQLPTNRTTVGKPGEVVKIVLDNISADDIIYTEPNN